MKTKNEKGMEKEPKKNIENVWASIAILSKILRQSWISSSFKASKAFTMLQMLHMTKKIYLYSRALRLH